MNNISIFSKDIITLNIVGEDIQQFGNFLFTKSLDPVIKGLYRLDVLYSTQSELQDILNVCDVAGDEDLFTEF